MRFESLLLNHNSATKCLQNVTDTAESLQSLPDMEELWESHTYTGKRLQSLIDTAEPLESVANIPELLQSYTAEPLRRLTDTAES